MVAEAGERMGGAHSPSAQGMHSGSSEEGRPTCETHDGRLELVVGMMAKREEGHAGGLECAEEEVVAGVACGALDGAGGAGGERRDAPANVCNAVGNAEEVGIFGSGYGHGSGSRLEMMHDMDGEEGGRGEELAEEEEEAGRVGAGRVGDGDGDGGARDTAGEGRRELEGVDRGQHGDTFG